MAVGKRVYALTIDGVTDTLAGWARRVGMREVTLYKRLDAGMSTIEALRPPPKGERRGPKARTFAALGLEDTIEGWARRVGIGERAMRERFKRLPPDEAVTLSAAHRRTPPPTTDATERAARLPTTEDRAKVLRLLAIARGSSDGARRTK